MTGRQWQETPGLTAPPNDLFYSAMDRGRAHNRTAVTEGRDGWATKQNKHISGRLTGRAAHEPATAGLAQV